MKKILMSTVGMAETAYYLLIAHFIAIIALIALLFSGCASPAQLAKEKDRALQAHMKTLQEVRTELPCDPIKIIEGRTVYIPGDSIQYPVYLNGDTIIKWVKCSPSKIRVDTFIKLDQAALQASRDSAEHFNYLFGVCTDTFADLAKENKELKIENASLKQFKGWAILICSVLFASSVILGIFKLKSFLI